MNRRVFGHRLLGSLLTFSLLETLMSSDALSDEIRPIAAKWLAGLHGLGNDVKGRRLTQTEWQEQVEQLLSNVDLQEFLTFVDFEKLIRELPFRSRGERAFQAQFPRVEGLPTEMVFGHQMFALQKNRSVVPHGHYNMASAFLILKGEFAGKHYDRFEDFDDHMIIRPTIDRKFVPGDYSTISDNKDNIHWFRATSDAAYIFNIHVLNIDPTQKKNGRVYIDPQGKTLDQGLIRAEKINLGQALARYG